MLGTLVKVELVAVVVGLMGVALFRPGTLFGVDGTALANSLGGNLDHAQAKCVEDGSGQWRCALRGGRMDGAEYVLTTHSFGCWSASRVSRRGAGAPGENAVSPAE
jgi:hypothetical protein